MLGDTRFQPSTRSFRAEGKLATPPDRVGGLRTKFIPRHQLGKRDIEIVIKKATRKKPGRPSEKTGAADYLF